MLRNALDLHQILTQRAPRRIQRKQSLTRMTVTMQAHTVITIQDSRSMVIMLVSRPDDLHGATVPPVRRTRRQS
jgi:hypothetical protein